MYLYKDSKSKYLQAEIWISEQKHRRSTRCTNRRETEAAARRMEAQLRAELKAETDAGASLQLGDVAARYMVDVVMGDFGDELDRTKP